MECTGKSITDICLDTGVESQRTFNRVFRERYKVTSREYRNLYHEQYISQTQDEISGMEKPDSIEEPVNLEATLGELLDEAVKRGLIEDSIVYRDLFDTRLMNCLMPRPGQVQKEFWDKYKESPKEATDYFIN